MPIPTFTTLASTLTLSALLHGAAVTNDDLHRENGVVVRDLGENAAGTPTFRAATVVAADMYTVIAVLADVEHYEDWMPEVIESHQVGDRKDRVYLRTRGSSVARDREVVLATSVTPLGFTSYRLRFRDVAFENGDDAAVRMEDLDGYYELRMRDDGSTQVVYRVAIDPGGAALIGLTEGRLTERIVDTLVALRKHSVRAQRRYRPAAARWRARHEAWMRQRVAKR